LKLASKNPIRTFYFFNT